MSEAYVEAKKKELLEGLQKWVELYEDGRITNRYGDTYNFEIGDITGQFEVRFSTGNCRPYDGDFELRGEWYNEDKTYSGYEYHGDICTGYVSDHIPWLTEELIDQFRKDFGIDPRENAAAKGWFD